VTEFSEFPGCQHVQGAVWTHSVAIAAPQSQVCLGVFERFEAVRSDSGSEFTARAVREWLSKVGVETLNIEPGSSRENGFVESLSDKLLDELLDGEIFYTAVEARVLIERWREHYNRVRAHSALGYRPSAPEAIAAARPSASLRAVHQRLTIG
jgi:transposase InsO family protein